MKNKKHIIIILSIISFIMPNAFVKINLLNYPIIILSVLCFTQLAIKTIKNKKYYDYNILILILWRISIFIPTLFHNGEILKWGYQSIAFIGLYLLIKNYINNKETLKLVYRIIFCYILTNIILMLFLPKGLFPEYGIHFLGIRTRFTEYSIALIYLSILYYEKFTNKQRNDKIIRNIAFIISIINISIQWVATGIISCLAIIFMYMIFKKFKKFKKMYIIGFSLLIIITLNIINGNILGLFEGLFNILNKDITLTGRTIIWENALTVIKNNFLFGSGYIQDGNVVNYAGGLWQAHNTLLQLMCECGLLGTILFFSIILKQGFPARKEKNKNLAALNTSIIFGYIITMITEILYYYPIFIFTIYLIGNYRNIINDTKEEQNDYQKIGTK